MGQGRGGRAVHSVAACLAQSYDEAGLREILASGSRQAARDPSAPVFDPNIEKDVPRATGPESNRTITQNAGRRIGKDGPSAGTIRTLARRRDLFASGHRGRTRD